MNRKASSEMILAQSFNNQINKNIKLVVITPLPQMETFHVIIIEQYFIVILHEILQELQVFQFYIYFN